MISRKVISLLTLLLLFTVSLLQAQDFDYEKYPKLDFKTEHLEGDIRVTDQAVIEGDISYTIRFRVGEVDSLVLHAVKMQVDDVLFNERTADFELVDDRLVIFIDEDVQRNDAATVTIRYSAEPKFGLHQNYLGSIYSSLLPITTRHWLPGLDHPSLSFTTDLSITHPSARQVITNGRIESSDVATVDEETTRFRSRYPVTSSSLFFAIGEFDQVVVENSNYSVIVSSEMPGVDEQKAEALAAEMIELLEFFTDFTGTDYPYSTIQLLLLNDLKWEIRNYAGGIVLADLNKDLFYQAKYGVLGQWAGLIASPKQWGEPEAIQLLKGYLANAAGLELVGDWDKPYAETIYNAFHVDGLEKWQHYLKSGTDLNTIVEIAGGDLFKSGGVQYDWASLSRVLYDMTGQPFFEKPQFKRPEREETPEYRYTATLEWEEGDSEVLIRFRADGDAVDELVSVTAVEHSLNEKRERSLDFTGSEEEVVLSVSPGIENLQLMITERDDIILEQEKPFMFWIYQVQNDEDAERRKEAAAGLRQYTENPDLQLALLDMLNIESNPRVYAEILNTLSYVTAGASGTDQIFLERASVNQPEVIQVSAAKALSVYSGNQQAISRLRSLAQNSEYKEVRRRSLKSLAEVTEPSSFRNIVETLMLRDNLLNEVPLMLNLLADAGESESAVRFSETFLSREFPVTVRLSVLELVLEHDQSSRNWENRLQNLLFDRDPRMRYNAAAAMSRISEDAREELKKSVLAGEFDERVYRKISGI